MQRTFLCALLAGAAIVLAAQPAAAVQQNGDQTIIDFEELAAGTTSIDYSGIDTHLTGGTVESGTTAGVTPHSGDNVYVGTSISSKQGDSNFDFNGVDLWPAMGAFVTPGAAAVTATFYGYSPDNRDMEELGSVTTSGSGANQFLSWIYDGNPNLWLIDVTFTSASTFAIDDLRLGLPDVGAGIPEPQAWALMALGLLAAGTALRRRRLAAA